MFSIPFSFCVDFGINPLSISLLFIQAPSFSSFSDILPKVETRVVLVGGAGRNASLVKALQVYHSYINPVINWHPVIWQA